MGPAGDPATGGASLYVEVGTRGVTIDSGLPTAEPGRVRIYVIGAGFTPGDAAFVELLVPMDEDGFVTADGTLTAAIFAAGGSVTPSGTFRSRTDFRVSIPEGIHTFRATDGHGIVASTVIVVAEK